MTKQTFSISCLFVSYVGAENHVGELEFMRSLKTFKQIFQQLYSLRTGLLIEEQDTC